MMKIPFAALVLFLAVLSLLPASMEAHHGWREFDENSQVTLEGTVTDFHYVNPHCVVEFDGKDDKGRIRKWQGEFSNPGVLSHRGWNAASLEPGDKLTITGHPARNGAPAVHVTRIVAANGEIKLELRE